MQPFQPAVSQIAATHRSSRRRLGRLAGSVVLTAATLVLFGTFSPAPVGAAPDGTQIFREALKRESGYGDYKANEIGRASCRERVSLTV